MTCGYCSESGHTMRQCNSNSAQHLLAGYRRTSMTPRTDQELNNYFRSFTSDMLSIIMYSYGARSVSVNRAAKEQFIRERILQARQVAPALTIAIPVQAATVVQARFVVHSPVGPPPELVQAAAVVQPVVQRVRETMVEYKARIQVSANTLFSSICIGAYNTTRYSETRTAEFLQMICMLSKAIITHTRNDFPEAFLISKLIVKQFHLRRTVAPVIKTFFYNELSREYRRVTDIRVAELRAQGLLPQPVYVQHVYVPHKPQFAAIQLWNIIAAENEDEDYCCGICAEDYTRTTIPTLGCDHTLCVECITGQIKARTKSCIKCPFCREEVQQISVQDDAIRTRISVLVAAEIAKNPL